MMRWYAKIFLLIGWIIFSSNPLLAQLSGDTLRGVEVTAPATGTTQAIKSSFEAGAKKQDIDATQRQAHELTNVASLLSDAATVFVKSYGFNAASTLTFRGASAAQSAVYWEGVPLMNGANGLTDLSTLPVSLIDSLSLDYGGNAALWGSGNVGGALMLQSKRPAFSKGAGDVRLCAGIGSFGQRTASLAADLGTPELSFGVRAQYLKADNDFPATDESGRTFRINNAAQEEWGVMLSGAWRSGSHSMFQAKYWLQAYNRQIPPALFEASSYKAQRDASSRLLVEWQHSGEHARSYVKAALFADSFRYNDSAINLQYAARNRHFFAEGGWTGRVGQGGKLLLFVPVQYFTLTDGGNPPSQLRAALGTAFSQAIAQNKILATANIRVESFDGKLITLPGVNAVYHLSNHYSIRANAQRSYRAPTLNELYYNPGGNQDLKPEQGWSIDGGYDWTPAGRLHFTHSLSAYNRNIDDWIIWLGGAIWTPHNLASVHSRGVETENAVSGTFRKFTWAAFLSASYTRSTPTESYLTNDGSIGRQLPYIPALLGRAELRLGYRAFGLGYDMHYTGRRYITSDESEWLDPFLVGNLRGSWLAVFKNCEAQFQGNINNIWNVHYEVVGYRPMPGVNYVLSAAIRLTKRGK